MDRLMKVLFVALLVKPLVFVALGLNVLNREELPKNGPAIVAANHNSHLDVMVLLALFPLSMVHRVRPVAAADYFLSNPVLSWFSRRVLNIIPLQRKVDKAHSAHLLDQCQQALDNGEILIIFPEGSRGLPERMGRLKKGIYRLVAERDNCPVFPVVMRGLGRALPRGTARLVPFNVDVVIGEGINEFADSRTFIDTMEARYKELATFCLTSIASDEDQAAD